MASAGKKTIRIYWQTPLRTLKCRQLLYLSWSAFYHICSAESETNFPPRSDAVPPAGKERLAWGNRLILSLDKNLDFGAPALPVQPGGKEELLLLVKKLGLHLVPLFLKFLGVRLPPGLKGQQVILILEPQGLLGIGVLPGKLNAAPVMDSACRCFRKPWNRVKKPLSLTGRPAAAATWSKGLPCLSSPNSRVASCSACFRARFFFNAAFTWSLTWARGGR